MTPGSWVRFKCDGKAITGTVVEVLTAGVEGRTGIHRQRERVTVHFTADGGEWETHRDVSEVVLLSMVQPGLFDGATS